jgi:hypothetical protein
MKPGKVPFPVKLESYSPFTIPNWSQIKLGVMSLGRNGYRWNEANRHR